MLRYRINPDSSVPAYRQLSDQINAEIRSGVLTNGTQLPTVREMAETMRLSCGTVKRAYDRLQEMGDIEMTRRKGTYVKYVRETEDSRKIRAMKSIDVMLRQLNELNFSLREIQIFLNLKLREWGLKRSGVRVALITDCAEIEPAVARQLSALGSVALTLYPPKQLREYPYSIDEQADVILLPTESPRAAETLPIDKTKIAAVAMASDGRLLFGLLPFLGKTVGVLCEGEAFFSLVCAHIPPEYARTLARVSYAELNDALPACAALVYPADALLPEGAEIERFRAENRLIPFRYALDEGSMLLMAQQLSRIRDERQVRPGGLEYD